MQWLICHNQQERHKRSRKRLQQVTGVCLHLKCNLQPANASIHTDICVLRLLWLMAYYSASKFKLY